MLTYFHAIFSFLGDLRIKIIISFLSYYCIMIKKYYYKVFIYCNNIIFFILELKYAYVKYWLIYIQDVLWKPPNNVKDFSYNLSNLTSDFPMENEKFFRPYAWRKERVSNTTKTISILNRYITILIIYCLSVITYIMIILSWDLCIYALEFSNQ